MERFQAKIPNYLNPMTPQVWHLAACGLWSLAPGSAVPDWWNKNSAIVIGILRLNEVSNYHLTPIRIPGMTTFCPLKSWILPTIRRPSANRAVAEKAELRTCTTIRNVIKMSLFCACNNFAYLTLHKFFSMGGIWCWQEKLKTIPRIVMTTMGVKRISFQTIRNSYSTKQQQ